MWLCGRCALWFFHYIQPSITHDFTLFKQFSAVKKRAKWGTTSIKSSLWYLDFDRSEYNAFWRCVQAGATYLFVQLCKVSEPCDTSLIRYITDTICVPVLETLSGHSEDLWYHFLDAVPCHFFPHLGRRSWRVWFCWGTWSFWKCITRNCQMFNFCSDFKFRCLQMHIIIWLCICYL